MNRFIRRRARVAILASLLLAAGGTGRASAQEPAPVDSLRAEVGRLRAQVDSLARVVARLRVEGRDTTAAVDELAELRAAAAAAAAAGGADTTAADADAGPVEFVGRQRNQQALNPEITVTGDVFGFVDAEHPEEQNFVARAFEISLQSALDPYTLAKVFLGYHVPGGEILPFGHGHEEEGEEPGEEPHAEEEGHGGALVVEEGYLQWRGLPGGINLSAGRFRQSFGRLNRWHSHALPGQTYPLPYLAFFGEEGLAQTGVSVHWLVPLSGLGTWELWTEVTTSENAALFGEARTPSILGRVNAFWDLSRSTYFEVGASGITGPGMGGGDAFATRVAGADFTLSWRPPERGRYREATLRGGVVYGELAPELLDPGPALGGFAIGELRLSQRWILGARYEYTENPLEPAESAWLVAPTLTWWQSEWVRLRAELDWLERPDETMTLFVLQATFAMGPHKHETY